MQRYDCEGGMSDFVHFVPSSVLDARSNLNDFVLFVRRTMLPLGLDRNRFDDNVWSTDGLIGKSNINKYIYFVQKPVTGKERFSYQRRVRCPQNDISIDLLMREPFLSFSKAIIAYLHCYKRTVTINCRVDALRYLEDALLKLNSCVCPTLCTPEVMNFACSSLRQKYCSSAAYAAAKQLEVIYRCMNELGILAVPSEWGCPVSTPRINVNRVGDVFDVDRKKKLPSPLAMDALANIFNSETKNPSAIFASSICALMLCSPSRSVEALFAPLNVLTPDWTDLETGEIGTGLRWFPAKGGRPLVKTVIPSMREIAVRAVERLRNFSAPARKIALWYESNPGKIYLPTNLEYLRNRDRINQNEIYAILFSGVVESCTIIQRMRVRNWLISNGVSRISVRTGVVKGTTVDFAELEAAVLTLLPESMPIMDPVTKMRFSEALCIARVGEFNSNVSFPSACIFDRIKYNVLRGALKSQGTNISIFEHFDFRDTDGSFLYLSTHMLRHYLNTLSRQSGMLTEDDIAKWSGRKSIRQNAVYNHESDRDVIAKLKKAVGDPSLSIGPFANIDNRNFVRRDEFANLKIITAHTSEFGYCIHDFAQLPCQVHQDCINCDEQVCVKGDTRAEENLRKTKAELTLLQEQARQAFSEEMLGAAEWFAYQSKTLLRVNDLIAILDDPDVPAGAVIQLSGVISPSRLTMADEARKIKTRKVSQTIRSLDDVRELLRDNN